MGKQLPVFWCLIAPFWPGMPWCSHSRSFRKGKKTFALVMAACRATCPYGGMQTSQKKNCPPVTVYWLYGLRLKSCPGRADPGSQHQFPSWYPDDGPPSTVSDFRWLQGRPKKNVQDNLELLLSCCFFPKSHLLAGQKSFSN